jgi:hypothetical protein
MEIISEFIQVVTKNTLEVINQEDRSETAMRQYLGSKNIIKVLPKNLEQEWLVEKLRQCLHLEI